MVFQNYAVFPHMTVRDNVAFGLRMTGADAARIARQVARATELLHIEPFLDRYPAQLSGGQRQRVAVARALAVEPAVLLMDEPLSNLDALLRLEMRAELKTVLQAAGTTTLYVTHDQTEAMGLADRIAVMHAGHIVQVAPPAEIYRHPASRFVGGFLGSPPMNFLAAAGHGRAGRAGQSAPCRPAWRRRSHVVLGIRPEDLEPVAEADGFRLHRAGGRAARLAHAADRAGRRCADPRHRGVGSAARRRFGAAPAAARRSTSPGSTRPAAPRWSAFAMNMIEPGAGDPARQRPRRLLRADRAAVSVPVELGFRLRRAWAGARSTRRAPGRRSPRC